MIKLKTLEISSVSQDKGISTNVVSFIGATTLRINAVGYEKENLMTLS